jgi:site-specific DNA-adenine methylase
VNVKKNFKDLQNEKYEDILKNTTILNVGFEYIFENYNIQNNFMFLDPPYDSKLSDYGYSKFSTQKTG